MTPAIPLVVSGAEPLESRRDLGPTMANLTSVRLAAAFTAAVILVGAGLVAQGQSALLYQDRGDRDEGLRSTGVSGNDLELLSARAYGPQVAGMEAKGLWAETVKARFYLPEPTGVFLVVRQLRSVLNYYWLSLPGRRIAKATPWQGSVTHEYAWPTSLVLAQVDGVSINNLGAVVRLDQPDEASKQRVAPVAIFDREAVENVDAYRFTWRPLNRVHVDASVAPQGSGPARQLRPRIWEDKGSQFTIEWRPGLAPEGWYRLVLNGEFSNSDKLAREVGFYHRRRLNDPVRRGSPR